MAARNHDVTLTGADLGTSRPYFFTSRRGGTKLAYKGYTYGQPYKLKNGTVKFTCDNYSGGCSAKIAFTENEIPSTEPHVGHLPDQDAVERKINKSALKQNAANYPADALLCESTVRISDSGAKDPQKESTRNSTAEEKRSSSTKKQHGVNDHLDNSCQICGRRFPHSFERNYHVSVHNQMTHKCGDCGWMFAEFFFLRNHYEKNHNKRLPTRHEGRYRIVKTSEAEDSRALRHGENAEEGGQTETQTEEQFSSEGQSMSDIVRPQVSPGRPNEHVQVYADGFPMDEKRAELEPAVRHISDSPGPPVLSPQLPLTPNFSPYRPVTQAVSHQRAVSLDVSVQPSAAQFVQNPALQDASLQFPVQDASVQPPLVQCASLQPSAAQGASLQPPEAQYAALQIPAATHGSIQTPDGQFVSLQLPVVTQVISLQHLTQQGASQGGSWNDPTIADSQHNSASVVASEASVVYAQPQASTSTSTAGFGFYAAQNGSYEIGSRTEARYDQHSLSAGTSETNRQLSTDLTGPQTGDGTPQNYPPQFNGVDQGPRTEALESKQSLLALQGSMEPSSGVINQIEPSFRVGVGSGKILGSGAAVGYVPTLSPPSSLSSSASSGSILSDDWTFLQMVQDSIWRKHGQSQPGVFEFAKRMYFSFLNSSPEPKDSIRYKILKSVLEGESDEARKGSKISPILID